MSGAPTQPNIVFILADDLGWADLSVYGQTHYQTPHLDAVAAEGVRFTQAYANSAVCSATRFGLITGRYQYRLRGGLEEPLVRKAHVHGLPPEHPTLPSLLRDAGYDTALIGKWHLGSLPTFGPLKSGYDRFFGNYGGAIDYVTHKPGVGDAVARDLYEGEVPVERVGYYTQLLADEATRWIGERSAAQPFFLSLHFTAPHWPWVGPEDEEISLGLKDLFHYDGGNLATYARMVRSLDKAVGQVLDALKAQGLADNTIVVFTSDNGPWLNFGRHAGSAGPFREGKGTTFEGGVRVPFIVRWPGVVKPDTRTDALAANIDVVPTIVEACAANKPKNEIDGQSFLALLKGEKSTAREIFSYYYGDRLEAVRKGKWKLHLPHAYRSYVDMIPAARDGLPATTHQRQIGLSLYDLEADQGEKNDVSAAHPEVVKELQELAAAERKKLDAGKRPVGRL